MNLNLSNILVGISKIDNQDDLHVVQDRVNAHWKKLTSRAADKFNIGDRVVFRTKTGIIQGTVLRINRATVAVRAAGTGARFGQHVTWRVSPSLLQKAQAGAV